MKQIFRNLYIETYKNFDQDVDNELSNLIKYNIKFVINLTECNLLNSCHRLSLLCNNIKCKDIFNNKDLLRIKNIPPIDRMDSDVDLRRKLREQIIGTQSEFIHKLSKEESNILFICNRNNVLSQLFVFIIMTLRDESHHIPIIIKDHDIVTSHKNECDIKKYLDKYIDIIYNKINEISKQAV